MLSNKKIIFLLFVLLEFSCKNPKDNEDLPDSLEEAQISLTSDPNKIVLKTTELEPCETKDGTIIYDVISCSGNICTSLLEKQAEKNGIKSEDICTKNNKAYQLVGTAALNAAKKVQSLSSPAPKAPTKAATATVDVKIPPSSALRWRAQSLTNSPTSVTRSANLQKADLNQGRVEISKKLHDTENLSKSLVDFRFKLKTSIQRLDLPRAELGTPLSANKIAFRIGMEPDPKVLNQTIEIFEQNTRTLSMAYDSIDFRLTELKRLNGDNPPTPEIRTLTDLKQQIDSIRAENNNVLKTLGEQIAVVVNYKIIKMTQITTLKASPRFKELSPDLQRYINDIYESRNISLGEASEGLSRQMAEEIAKFPITIMMRKVTDPGFQALALGKPSKRLFLKAKSNHLGEISINPVFTHKIKANQREMFSEFSWQSQSEILRDGLPNSRNKVVVKKIQIDGKEVEVVGVRRLDSIDPPVIDGVQQNAEITWVRKADYDGGSYPKNEYALYEVHADPRSMKGGTEDKLAEWKKSLTTRQEAGGVNIRGPPGSWIRKSRTQKEIENSKPKHLGPDQWAVDPFGTRKTIEDEAGIRAKQFQYAENLNSDYAEFLIRKDILEGKYKDLLDTSSVRPESDLSEFTRRISSDLEGITDPYDPRLTDLLETRGLDIMVAKRLDTAGEIAPDIDMLSVGTKKGGVETVRADSELGTVNTTAERLLRETGKMYEQAGFQKAMHHGSEHKNIEFPQNLMDDYPISIVTSSGKYIKIGKGTGEEGAHAKLFEYMKNSEGGANPVSLALNPAYIVQNKAQFTKIPADKWPSAQVREIQDFDLYVSAQLATKKARHAEIEIDLQRLRSEKKTSSGSKIGQLEAEQEKLAKEITAFETTKGQLDDFALSFDNKELGRHIIGREIKTPSSTP